MNRPTLFLILAWTLTGAACDDDETRFAVTSRPSDATVAGALYSYQVTTPTLASGAGYELLTAPTGLSLDRSGLVQWTPALDQLGTHVVTIRVSSGFQHAVQTWNLRVHQGVALGVTLSPRGHTASSTEADVAQHFAPDASFGSLRAFHTHWRDAVTADGEVPAQADFAATSAANHGFTLAVVVGWHDRDGSPDLTSEATPGDNSWRNDETRQEFLAMVETFAGTYRPAFLLLGDETNAYFVTHSQADWDAWISEFAVCYDAIKAASPSTVVGTTFQLERMKGGGARAGWSDPAHWDLIDDHAASGKIDTVAFHSYPYFDHDTPSALPADYYREISTHWSGPVTFAQVGWLTAPSGPFPGSEADQAEFVDVFFERSAGLDLRYVAWRYLHDWDEEATVEPYVGVGLRSNDGSVIRAADARWAHAVALRQR
ncbi:MAG: Ig domain-containing protein [Planctomycetota bacterium]